MIKIIACLAGLAIVLAVGAFGAGVYLDQHDRSAHQQECAAKAAMPHDETRAFANFDPTCNH